MFGFPSSKVWAAAGVLLAVALIALAGYGYGYGSGKADATAEAAEAMDKYKEEVRAREREQESCISLTHSRCWNPRAELRTHCEYGFGFGQVTVAYRPDGSERMNVFNELRSTHASLRDWTWENRYDPGFQLTAIVEMNRSLWRRIAANPGATVTDHWGFVLSSYNGGLAGFLQDRRLCSNTRGCDPARWFEHVERTSLKSRVPQPGYAGQSWFEINRKHARNVLTLRRDKYKAFWGL